MEVEIGDRGGDQCGWGGRGWRSVIHGSWIMGLVRDGDGDGWVWLERAGFLWVWSVWRSVIEVGYTSAESELEDHRLQRTWRQKVIVSISIERDVIFVLFC